jgi:hypothetical protein
MEHFDEIWDEGALEELELDSDPEELWRSLIADEEYPRYWSESVWTHDAEDVFDEGPLLFVDREAESRLGHELRLSELWDLCEGGGLGVDEYFELSALIDEVPSLPGSLCADCKMLGRPNVNRNWALAATTLCRSHLHFRLEHARIDGGTGR